MSSKHALRVFGLLSPLFVFLAVLSNPNTVLADHLVRPIASDLSARADHVWNAAQDRLQERYYGGPEGESAMMLYMALANFANSARLYKNFANSFADENLRGGAKSLLQQAEVIDRMMERVGVFGHLRDDWRRVQERLGALAYQFGISTHYPAPYDRREGGRREREFSEPRDDHGRGRRGGDPHGTFRWRGQVDGEDLIRLRGREVWIDHVAANPVANASYDLSGPFPNFPVKVDLKRRRGRGDVELVERPSPENGFTLTVRVRDEKSGSDFYEFEVIW